MSKIGATVIETDESLYSVAIKTNGHEITGDEPESYGSQNLGPAPYDLLLAALGECIVMTVRWAAIQNKWPLEKVEAQVTHEKQGSNIANKCPVYRTLTSEVTIL